MQNLIRIVISTLNEVEVKGKDNLDKLLGSINALESVVEIMEASSEPTPKEELKMKASSKPTPKEELKEEANG